MGNPGNTEKVIAICDRDISYAGRLVEYLRQEAAFPCEIRLYTGADKLLEDPECRDMALIVIAQSQYTEAVKEARFENLLLLNESDEWIEEPENISKFQSITNIALSIRKKCLVGDEPVVASMRHGSPMVRIGVYTPVQQKDTAFRLLNDMLRSGESAMRILANITGQLELMTEEVGGLHFLPPMKSFIELRSIRKEQWSSLLRTIEKVTEYEYLLMDLTEHTDGLFDLLRTCDKVYTIVRDDTFSRAKYFQYEDLLRRSNYEDVRMRTEHWKFPVFRELPSGLGDLTRGELAAYIRSQLLSGEYD